MDNDSLVSIIIPTYNRSALLTEAIQSVVSQTYRPIECIVVDDGSTDTTREVVSKVRIKDISSFTVKYIYQQNAGSQIARNTGTSSATGEFIQYLDSDDLLYPDKIKSQVDYFNQHPDCDAVFGDWEKGNFDEKEQVIVYKSDDLIRQFLTEKCIANFAMLMRKHLVNKIGNWDVNIKRNQEIDFHLRGVLAGGKFEYESSLTGLWRCHSGGRIATNTNFSSAISFYAKWEEKLKQSANWNEKIQYGIVNNYVWFLNKYPNSSNHEMIKLLGEIKRLQPSHPIFKSEKFKICDKLFGSKAAFYLWIMTFKKNIKNK